jgi:hypothetical protein
MVQRTLSDDHLNRYFQVTTTALKVAKDAPRKKADADIVLDMADRYVQDAAYFKEQGKLLLAFAALNYAHGWLDAGARLGLFVVHDSSLFVVDAKVSKPRSDSKDL